MRDSSDATLQPIKVDYLQDTLFGVNALASECTGSLCALRPVCSCDLRRHGPRNC